MSDRVVAMPVAETVPSCFGFSVVAVAQRSLDLDASVWWLWQWQRSLASSPQRGGCWSLVVRVAVWYHTEALTPVAVRESEAVPSCTFFSVVAVGRWSLDAVASVWWLCLCWHWSLITLPHSGGHGCVDRGLWLQRQQCGFQ